MLTRADVIRLAREAGFEVGRDAGGEYVAPQYSDSVGTLVRFAALVAAAEREACARMCDDMEKAANKPKWAIWTAEGKVSAAIRARGEKGGV